MILGIGSNICDIRRIESAIGRHGARFMERAFTETERARRRGGRRRSRPPHLRQALRRQGTRHRLPQRVFFSDLGVVNLPGGKPTLAVTGGSADRPRALTPAGMIAQVDLTMTDECPYAYAQLIISAVPAPR